MSDGVQSTPPSSMFSPTCLQGKVALITGGGSGICFEIARQLLLHGASGVMICGRRENFLQRACALLQKEVQEKAAKVIYAVVDVRKPEMCTAAVEKCRSVFGSLHILVNGAAGNFLAQAKDLSPKGFAIVMAIDTLGTYNMCHAAYPLLNASANDNKSTAVIINISATLQYGATWWQTHASAAKSAVDSMTRSLALEWGSSRIRVVGIAPGPIANTPGTTKLAPGEGAADALSALIKEGIPLERLGQAFEIGHAAVYLSTAEYVTGNVLVVDGGQWLYRPPMVPAELVGQLSRQVEQKSRNQEPTASL